MKTIWHYNKYLPPTDPACRISIGEGQTPLIRSRYLGPSLGLNHLYFKLENLNPTGSYKDRFAAVFTAGLVQKNSALCLATSSGNTGAALAAYCGAAGIRCFIAVVDGAPEAKLRQIEFYGAKTIMIEGFGIDPQVTTGVFSMLEGFAAGKNIALPISAYRYCPDGMQGVQTIAYEIADELQGRVQHIFSPAGGGGLTLALARGVLNYEAGSTCRVHCVQPIGNNTIAGPLAEGLKDAVRIPASTTAISGLQVPDVLDGSETIRLCRQTGGTGHLVADDDVLAMQQLLAHHEGIFCEPAAAVSVEGLRGAARKGAIGSDECVVCVVTGSGFKDQTLIGSGGAMAAARQTCSRREFENYLATIE